MQAVRANIGIRLFGWVVFAVYIAITFYLLFMRDHADLFLYTRAPDPYAWTPPLVNVEPFETIAKYTHSDNRYNYDMWFRLLVGNLLLFVPLGLFVPLLFTGMRNFWRFAALAIIVITGVELTQKYSLTGYFDIDDILLNVIGALVGYALARFAFRLTPAKKEVARARS